MRRRIIYLILSALVASSYAAEVNVSNENHEFETKRDGRALNNNYFDILRCAGRFDTACLLDKSEDLLIAQHHKLLVEADASALTSGRKSDKDESPSALMESIGHLISEISEVFFKHGFAGIFRDGKENDDEEEEETTDAQADEAEEDEDDEDEDEKARNLNGVARKKKKKGKLKNIIKFIVLAIALFGKLTILLKVLAAHLQVKFLIIAAAGLVLNAARFYLDLKKGHQPQKVIYYEHAQHQHHYENSEDDWSGGGGGGHGGYWSRSLDKVEDDTPAQNLAYAAHKPVVYAKTKSGSASDGFSWF